MSPGTMLGSTLPLPSGLPGWEPKEPHNLLHLAADRGKTGLPQVGAHTRTTFQRVSDELILSISGSQMLVFSIL